MKKEKKEIRVCNCGTPLIWTFRFIGCEYYCLNCGREGGMFGTGRDVEVTQELILQYNIVNAIWKTLSAKGWYCGSGRLIKCKKCQKNDEQHYKHLTKKELKGQELAIKYMDFFNKGFLNINK